MTLCRRDRAALKLALECLRSCWPCEPFDRNAQEMVESAREALYCGAVASHGDSVADQILAACRDISWVRMREWRILRARLALLLRAVLRADAGDFGPYACPVCGTRCAASYGWLPNDDRAYTLACECEDVPLPWKVDIRIRPLWESARPHR